MLKSFEIIVAVDNKNGIGKNGTIPWRNKEDMDHFKEVTIGKGNNVVIMGRKTYESIPKKFRPLPNRKNIVISSNNVEGVDNYKSIGEALNKCSNYDKVFMCGGQGIYDECINKYLYLCNKVWISHIEGDFNCDVFFPYNNIKSSHPEELINKNSFKLEIIGLYNINHLESQYLQLLDNILSDGEVREDRTGTGTKALFGATMKFDLREGFPLITTKKVSFNMILKELLFFISGKTDTKILEEQGVNIWKGNTNKDFLEKRGLPYKEGDMGAGYGWQWRHAGETYKGCDKDYGGIDQLQNVIKSIKEDPYGRRHIVSAWDVANIDKMALPPCHCFFQLYVSNDGFLDCQMYQRSADMFLGVPFNIASYALLTIMIAHLTDLNPRYFHHILGDTHIYLNHIEQVKEQVSRTPYPFSTLKINRKVETIDNFKFEDFTLEKYLHHSKLNGKMSI